MNFRKYTTVLLLFFVSKMMSQNTVGTIINTPQSYNGYTLFCPISSFQSYLVDNCGRVVNSWSSSFQPGLAAYLLEDGSLMRSGRILNSSMSIGGLGGIIEKLSWDNVQLWRYRCSGPDSTSHHDFKVLPNGNVLLLTVYAKNISEAVSIGRDPAINSDSVLFSESVIEIEPIGSDSGRIVWRWDSWNHLIQDRDSTKPNFGIISDHPERMNINYIGNSNTRDWLHANSIDYNPQLDQIIVGFRNTNEFWIIDHSTSIAEAAGSSGGRYGKGGDILYRWGNPAAYNRGTATDQKLFGQHDVRWIAAGLPGEGNILIFNNGDISGISSVDEIQAPTDSAGFYTDPAALAYGPQFPLWSHSDPTNTVFNSPRLSSAERLPNGNTLICSGFAGYISEVDNIGNTVWSYRNPVSGTGILTQGNPVNLGVNSLFSSWRYGTDYAAFNGRNLVAANPIELNFDISGCSIYTGTTGEMEKTPYLKIFPNPAKDFIFLESSNTIHSVKLYSSTGSLMRSFSDIGSTIFSIPLSDFNPGLYIIEIDSVIYKISLM